jgi:signal transduction histidine kinase
MQTVNSLKQSEGWESLVGLWDRANTIRTFLWQQQYSDARALLNQYLVRLRRLYGVDFCAGGLLLDAGDLASAAVPEAGLDRLPAHFARRCLDLVAHARTPISWNEVKAEFGFRSMVVAPIAPPSAEPMGFLMLGQSTRRLYSAAELFVLQTLAGELSWVGRSLSGKENQREQFTDVSHEIKNTLQLLVSNMGFLRESLSEPLSGEQEKFFSAMDSSVERLTGQLNRVPDVVESEAASEFMLSAPSQSDRES